MVNRKHFLCYGKGRLSTDIYCVKIFLKKRGNEMDYGEKIKKLLALSESPNIHEARSALLKARQLMAEYGIAEPPDDRQEVAHIESGISYSEYRDPWAAHLAEIIGEAYRCMGYTVKGRGRTCTASFIGLEDDVRLCNKIFRYAVRCIRAGNKEIRKGAIHFQPEEIRRQCDSYGYGFTYGIKSAFQQQEEGQPAEWALALSMPLKVRQVFDALVFGEDFHADVESSLSRDAFAKGMDEGKRFAPEKQIGDII